MNDSSFATPARAEIMNRSRNTSTMREEVRMLELSGAHISYARCGAGTGLLFIQGVGAIGAAWRPQTEDLSRFFSTVTLDNRGIGSSVNRGGGLTVEAMADDALAVMDAEELDRFHVVGHSMGGLIAQEVALRAPRRVKSLSLLCTFARGAQGARMTPAMMLAALRTRVGTRAMRRRAFLQLVVPPEIMAARSTATLADELGRLFGRDLAEQPAIIMKQVQAMGRYDAADRLGSLGAVPTLVVSAELDRIARPAFGRQLAAAIPGARFVVLPGAGHGVPILDPRSINDLLRAHLASAER